MASRDVHKNANPVDKNQHRLS